MLASWLHLPIVPPSPQPTAYNCSKVLPRLVGLIVRPGHSQAFPQAGVQKCRVSCTPPLASRVCPSAIPRRLSPASQCHRHSASEIPRQRVSPPSPSWPGAFASMMGACGSIQDVMAPVLVSFRAISSEAVGICQPACFGRAIQFSGTWRFPRPLEGERGRVRGCPGHGARPSPQPSPWPGRGGKRKTAWP